jgi:hypothetical protein
VSSSLLALALLAASPDDLQVCNFASVRAQELSRAGKLLDARAELMTCLRAECDAPLRTVCENLVKDLETRLPAVRIEVRGPTGAAVFVDGNAVGLGPVELDPGKHTLRVEAPGWETLTQAFHASEGDRERVVVATLVPPSAPAAAVDVSKHSRLQLHPATYVLGAVALVGLASFITWALVGKGTEAQLRTTCPMGPCDSGPMRREYAAADISLAVTVLTAGAALWVAFKL